MSTTSRRPDDPLPKSMSNSSWALQVVGIGTTIWMFLTPLFWTPVVMPPSVGEYLPLIEANPVFHLVQAWRIALMGGIHVPPNENILGGWAVEPARLSLLFGLIDTSLPSRLLQFQFTFGQSF